MLHLILKIVYSVKIIAIILQMQNYFNLMKVHSKKQNFNFNKILNKNFPILLMVLYIKVAIKY